DLHGGQHRAGIPGRPGSFTTAFFHHPHELADEVREAALKLQCLFAVEGPGGWFADADNSPAERERLLWAARQTETEPTLLGASAHLLAIARHAEDASG